ncbi:MAG: SUMF1/EgtB/PvdO family nonheme iron enzyme, partial [Bacteroidetes bacterium]|nr:SUMF1/EgtB/PvdO family nonheme iron enzyme [Bacteroidota bacterium]
MKKLNFLIFGFIPIAFLSGCGISGNGEVIGVQDRVAWYAPDPYGMVYVRMGSYNMGPNDQDVPWAMTTTAKTVSIHPFWMDQTEITNNEYRQFVYWVKDSIAKMKLGETLENHLITINAFDEEIDPPFLNWNEKIIWDGEEERDILNEMYLPEHERFYRRKEIDTRKLMFTYFWIDLKQA